LSNVIGIHWHLFDPSTTTTHTLTLVVLFIVGPPQSVWTDTTSVSSVSSVKSVSQVSQSRYPSHYVGPRV
jgi:hypothetical protein